MIAEGLTFRDPSFAFVEG